MPRKKNETKPMIDQDILAEQQQQIQQLQDKIQQLENVKPQMPNHNLMDEITKIKRKSRVSTNQIPYKEIDDHQNIYLYTPLNHRVGALHPSNAVETIQRWYSKGYMLYTEPRTAEQIEEYKRSDFHKREVARNKATRSKYRENTRKGQYERVAEIIAKETGKSIDKLTEVISPANQ